MSNEEHLVENIFHAVERRSKQGVGAYGTDYLFDEIDDDFVEKNDLKYLMSNGDLEISKETLRHLINMASYMLYHLDDIYHDLREENSNETVG